MTVVLIIVGFFVAGVVYVLAKQQALKDAPAGSVRVETVKANLVKSTVRQYTDTGWVLDAQSSAKSFGTQTRVTLTFRKPQ